MASRVAVRGRRLYLITDASPRAGLVRLIESAVRGGVDLIQLREKSLNDSELFEVAASCARLCRSLEVPFIVNDRADIALAAKADGVHLGQDDLPAGEARELLGDSKIIGLSTHSKEQIDAAGEDVDYIGVGPIYDTPTKPGWPAVGVELVNYAAAHAAMPFFAIGGLEPRNIGAVVRAGAGAISVFRYVSHSLDPERAARELIAAMDDAQPKGANEPARSEERAAQ
jgi:thiamine-phosphate pyrophosphorylase